MPDISVVLAVYNGMPYLPETIDSILSQTFKNFEFIIIEDGSQDDTLSYIESLRDSRIKIVKNEKNLGVSLSRNKGFNLAQSPFVVIVDADDINLQYRFALQYEFMRENPDIWASSGQMLQFGAINGKFSMPLANEDALPTMFFYCPVMHPAAIVRLDKIKEHGIKYDAQYRYAQDYDLWANMACCPGARMANIPEEILHYREHAQSITHTGATIFAQEVDDIRLKLLYRLNLHPTQEEFALHLILAEHKEPEYTVPFLEKMHQWMATFGNANRRVQLIPPELLDRLLAKRWHGYCVAALRRKVPGAWRLLSKQYSRALSWKDDAHLWRSAARKIKKTVLNG